jgi:hypothetical protein
VGSNVAQRLTTKQVSAANLYRSWEKLGKPDDSVIIADILRQNNVTDDVIQDIYGTMNIELAKPASGTSSSTATTTTSAASTAGSSAPTSSTTAVRTKSKFKPTGRTYNPATVAQTTPAAPAPAVKYKSPLEVVDAIINTMPKDWLPEITAELLKRQRVSATKK